LNKEELFKKIESYAVDVLSEKRICGLVYHNIKHTRNVVRNVEIIGLHEEVSEEEMFILKTAAWFHDLGYINTYDGHEDESKIIAKKFLIKEGAVEFIIDSVLSAIDATRVPQKPKNKLEEIIADADLFDLGTEAYFELSECLFSEWNDCGKQGEINRMWEISLEFMKGHTYFTSYGIIFLTPVKQAHISTLEKRLK
jgi:hypothetical protein